MFLKIPIKTKFIIDYDKVNTNYYSGNSLAKTLFKKLLEASNNRCMYCGENLQGLSAEFKILEMEGISFNREHTIEKQIMGTKEKILENCKFNFGIACFNCNNKKKNNVIVDEKILQSLNTKNCSETCETPCEEYLNLLNNYKEKNLIITMPRGLKNEFDEDIIYNTENLIFQLNEKNSYTETEARIICNHIELFLSRFQNKCLDDLITHLIERNNFENLPSKKTIFDRKNRFRSVVSDNLLDILNTKTPIQRKIIIDIIKKKMERSSGKKIEE